MINLGTLLDESVVVRKVGTQWEIVIWEYDRRSMTESEAREIKQVIFDNHIVVNRVKNLLESKIEDSDGVRIAQTITVRELEKVLESN